jgi:hypothetical protein
LYLAARLVQAKILVAHARLHVESGGGIRPRIILWRASRKLGKGRYLADEAESDAIGKILKQVESAKRLVWSDSGKAADELSGVEAKIVALLDKL